MTESATHEYRSRSCGVNIAALLDFGMGKPPRTSRFPLSNPDVAYAARGLRFAPLVHTGRADRPRPKAWTVPLRKKEVLSSALKSASGISTRSAAILPRNGVAPWGRFCIFREGERGRGKNEHQRGGGCAKPLRGQAPVTPNSLILRSFHLATRYKSQDFVERDPREIVNLPESQIFKT